MKYTFLGRTGLQVSRLCLGTMNFGPRTNEKDSFHIMDHAHETGINFFDTANVYGEKKGEGVTEKIIGNWFSKGGGRREKTVLATKVYGQMDDWPNNERLSALNIIRSCEASLKRLQTDRIDLFQMHHVWRRTPWEEIWQAMEQLVREGKILYVGSSNFAAWNLVEANEKARTRNFLGLVSEQSFYNLNVRTIELEVIPACEAYGIGLIPWSPLAGGLLAGVLESKDQGRRASQFVQERLAQHRDRIEAYEKLCKDVGIKPAVLALAWLLSRPVVTAPIIGPRTVEQLDDELKALEVDLNEDTLKKLDEIFPGPGGQAPEAYAW